MHDNEYTPRPPPPKNPTPSPTPHFTHPHMYMHLLRHPTCKTKQKRSTKQAAAAAAEAAARPRRWARVHLGCTLLRVLSYEGHVVAGATPTLLVFPKKAQAHADFLRDSGGRIVDLAP